jgi:hypothetical protein
MAAPVKAPVESEAEIKRAVSINVDLIQEEYARVPSDLSRWIFRRVELTKAYRLAELDLDIVKEKTKAALAASEAETKVRLRQENDEALAKAEKDSKAKRLTDDGLAALVLLDVGHQQVRKDGAAAREKAERAVIDAEDARGRAAGMVDALVAKKEMLISLGADLRSEKEGDPSIRDRQRR